MPQNPIHRAEYQAFILRLRAAREASGLTQVEAAKRLRKHQSFVSKCEVGERRVDAVEAVAFATLYNISLDQLLIGAETEQAPEPGK